MAEEGAITGPRVRAFACGTTTHALGALFAGGPRGARVFPAWVFLVDAPGGARVLVDTGYRVGRWRTGWRGWAYRRLVPPRVRAAQSAAAQLAAAGVDPASVTHVMLTHLHPDHVGGLADFPQATVVITQGTAALASAARAKDGVLAGLLPRPFPPAGAVVVGDADFRGLALAGGPTLRVADPGVDPSVLLVDLPGHSPGHVGVLVGERLLLAGDAAWSVDLLHLAASLRPLPRAITHDHPALVDTARLLLAVRDAGVTVVCGHDPELPAELLP